MLMFIYIALGCVFIAWLFYALPFKMAEARHRSGIRWILIASLITPIGAALLLWLLGDAFDQ